MIYEIGNGMKRVDVQANDPRNNLQVGQVIQLNGYSNPKYVIIKNLGMLSRFCCGNQYECINLNDGTVTRKEAFTLKFLSEKVDGRIQSYITDEVLDADGIMDAINFRDQKEKERIAAQAAKDQATAADFDRLNREYSFLEKVDGNKKSPAAVGAANIRKELKKAFPGVKFSVTSEYFSMGNVISINYSDGPSREEVEKITDKYEKGKFDGMNDIYEYSNSQFPKIFGGAKYVQVSRNNRM